jgi:hypothetical protein
MNKMQDIYLLTRGSAGNIAQLIPAVSHYFQLQPFVHVFKHNTSCWWYVEIGKLYLVVSQRKCLRIRLLDC